MINTANIYFNIVKNVFFYLFLSDCGHLCHWMEYWQACKSFLFHLLNLSYFLQFFLYNLPCEYHKDCSHFPSEVALFDTFLVRSLLHMHTLKVHFNNYLFQSSVTVSCDQKASTTSLTQKRFKTINSIQSNELESEISLFTCAFNGELCPYTANAVYTVSLCLIEICNKEKLPGWYIYPCFRVLDEFGKLNSIFTS